MLPPEPAELEAPSEPSPQRRRHGYREHRVAEDDRAEREARVLTRDIIDTIPTAKSISNLAALVPGMSVLGATTPGQDVGGTSGMQNRDISVHGSDGRDMTFMIDGMILNGIEGDGSVQSYFNEMMFEEITYQTSGISAETSAGGVRANMIPKDGGNVFNGAGRAFLHKADVVLAIGFYFVH